MRTISTACWPKQTMKRSASVSSSSRISIEAILSKRQPTVSASQNQLGVAGHDAGTRVVSDFLRRTSGTDVPRSSAKPNNNSSLNSFVMDNRGNHRRSSISLTKSSTLSTIRFTSVNFSTILVSPTLYLELNGLHDRMMPKKFSTSASPTRSTRVTPMSLITNAKVTRRKVGWLTTISAQTAVLYWDFLMRHIHSRGTILTGCGTSMIRILNDRW
ncbi:transposase [Halalkaliarchaeum desulfuricum]|uniref:Transposase n=1 Tax=Halalkaliarchaeum desulfuricum TaxID=2055893 RepID=A0A343TN94_9EURY|nr:transposase [Halalkaliarchaeum desulfuricum]